MSICFSACATHSAFAPHFPTHSINPEQIYEVQSPDPSQPRFDPSALFLYEGKFLTVSDREYYTDIYELIPSGSKLFTSKVFLKLKLPHLKKKAPRYDFEGLTYCGGKFFIADERHMDVIEVSLEGKLKIHHPDIRSIHLRAKMAPASGTDNGGYEGIACDSKNQLLYLANERQFRMIYSVSLKNWQTLDFFDVPSGWNLPFQEKGFKAFQDFAELYFENGFLYALQRNDRKILKIAPKEQRIISAVSLNFLEKDFYETSEPIGLAEGQTMDRENIWIILDNNGVKRKAPATGINAVLIKFKRPKDF